MTASLIEAIITRARDIADHSASGLDAAARLSASATKHRHLSRFDVHALSAGRRDGRPPRDEAARAKTGAGLGVNTTLR